VETHELNNRPAAPAPASEIDSVKLQMTIQQLKDNQNLPFALLGGAAAALVGAVLWAVVTAVTNWQIGFMAVGVGFLVGLAVRKLGQGVSISFGVIGAVFSLAGCVLGNYLANCSIIAAQQNMSILDVLKQVDFKIAVDIMVQVFHPMDALFYVIAIYYGYKYSFKTLALEKPKAA